MGLIQIIDVSKKFREKGGWVVALDKVNLDIEKGEIFGLLGPNGAGKTTLLNIILGLLLPDEGSVKIMGQDIKRKPDIVERMNYVSGETRFHWVLTVKDVLWFYGRSYGISGKKLKQRIEKLLEFFALGRIAGRKFDTLSTGEKMRLRFAKALLNDPEILLFDEPTLGLDPPMTIKVREEIARINREFGTTVLLTSHYMQEVEKLCRRIAFIHKGRLLDIGTVEQVKKALFPFYRIIVEVDELKDPDLLAKRGFEVEDRKIFIPVSHYEDPGRLICFLSDSGYRILDIEVKKPTLEDYFIKILEKEK
ncbi:ABC transporter ATP-binding protein [Candidatus Aerophobetes bacterium]|nr:ABC transporter ATP-binding protein [Candidatus Aerophobetes bacterium]